MRIRQKNKPCEYSESCFDCPLPDCKLNDSAAVSVNEILPCDAVVFSAMDDNKNKKQEEVSE